MLAGQITLSPVKADPFFGHCEVAAADLKKARVYLELGALAPEIAARVTVNGKSAGRFHQQACPPRDQRAFETGLQHLPHRALCARIRPAGDLPEARAGMTAIHDSFPENAGAGGDWGRRLFACARRELVYCQCMAFVTLTINTEAHRRLKKLKAPGDSFSDVILRELPEPWETAGDVLDGLERMQVPKADPELRAAVLAGRGRRSPRK